MAERTFARFDPAEQARNLRLHLSLCPEGQTLTLDMSKAYCQGLIDALERDRKAADTMAAAAAVYRAAQAMAPLRKAQERERFAIATFGAWVGILYMQALQSLAQLVLWWLA